MPYANSSAPAGGSSFCLACVSGLISRCLRTISRSHRGRISRHSGPRHIEPCDVGAMRTLQLGRRTSKTAVESVPVGGHRFGDNEHSNSVLRSSFYPFAKNHAEGRRSRKLSAQRAFHRRLYNVGIAPVIELDIDAPQNSDRDTCSKESLHDCCLAQGAPTNRSGRQKTTRRSSL